MSKQTLASKLWNAEPFEVRRRLVGLGMEHQIRDIRVEMERAKRAHNRHMAECRAHIKSLEGALGRWEREQEEATSDTEGK